MPARKTVAKAPAKAPREEEVPAGESSARRTLGHTQPAAAIDVFVAAPIAMATAAATTAAAKQDSATKSTRELSGSQREVAEARGTGRMSEEELRAAADSKDKPGTVDDQGPALTSPSGRTGGGSPSSGMDLRGRMGDLRETNSQNQGGMDTSAITSGTLPSIGRSADDVMGDTALPWSPTGAAPTNLGIGKAAISDAALAAAVASADQQYPNSGVGGGGGSSGGSGGSSSGNGSSGNAGGSGSTGNAGSAFVPVKYDENDGVTGGSSNASSWRQEYPTLAKVADWFSGTPGPTTEQINEAVKEIDSLGAPASGSSGSASGSSNDGGTDAGTTGGSVGQPEPDAVDPAKVLAWQQYLANNGLLNMNNPNSIDNKSNPSPEATGGGGGPVMGLRAQTKNDLLGQPAGPDDEQTGGGGTSPDDRRAWASNPGPDGSVSDGGKQIEEDPADIDTTPNGDLSHLLNSNSDDDSDTQSAVHRYYAGRVSYAAKDDDD